MYCFYYQAQVLISKTWFLTAILHSFEHLCFDRTLIKRLNNSEYGLFEFLVPQGQEACFIEVLNIFIKVDIVQNLQKLDNRLKDS